MPGDKHNPSPRIYLAKRHREWFYDIPQFKRSKIINAALDVYRSKKGAEPQIDSQIDSPARDQKQNDSSSGVQ